MPPFEDYSMKHRTYRYFDGQPLYPFGYGLSYSKFTYTNLKLSASKLHAGDPLSVEVDITNTSDRAGDEVAELYLHFPKSAGALIRLESRKQGRRPNRGRWPLPHQCRWRAAGDWRSGSGDFFFNSRQTEIAGIGGCIEPASEEQRTLDYHSGLPLGPLENELGDAM